MPFTRQRLVKLLIFGAAAVLALSAVVTAGALAARFGTGSGLADAVSQRMVFALFFLDSMETVGLRTTIRSAYREVALIFRIEPPHSIVVERIRMFYKGLRLEGQEGSHLSAYLPNGDLWFRATDGAQLIGCRKGIVLDTA